MQWNHSLQLSVLCVLNFEVFDPGEYNRENFPLPFLKRNIYRTVAFRFCNFYVILFYICLKCYNHHVSKSGEVKRRCTIPKIYYFEYVLYFFYTLQFHWWGFIIRGIHVVTNGQWMDKANVVDSPNIMKPRTYKIRENDIPNTECKTKVVYLKNKSELLKTPQTPCIFYSYTSSVALPRYKIRKVSCSVLIYKTPLAIHFCACSSSELK